LQDKIPAIATDFMAFQLKGGEGLGTKPEDPWFYL